MNPDLITMYQTIQAEQRLIARRAERAWMTSEAKAQGRFTSRPSTVSRLKLLIVSIAGLAGRRSAEDTTAQPVVRRRSANAS